MDKAGIENAKLRYTLRKLRSVKCSNFRVVGPAKRRLSELFHAGKCTGVLVALNTRAERCGKKSKNSRSGLRQAI